jgi:bifunctional non-homologous end joining protein LigD
MLPPDLMLATPCTLPRDTAAATLTASGEWTVEVKLDGIRACVTIDGDKVRITNRTGRDITIRYPEIVQALSGLGIRAVLDGEIVVMVNGKPNFHAVQIRDAQSNPKAALALSRKTPARFIAFDVLVVNGIDVTGPRGLTYEARHDRLEALARDSELDINPVFDDGGPCGRSSWPSRQKGSCSSAGRPSTSPVIDPTGSRSSGSPASAHW